MLDPVISPRQRRHRAAAAGQRAASTCRTSSSSSPRSKRSRRRLIPQLEGLKREQNAAGDEVARAKRQGLDAKPIFEANKQRAQKIKQMEIELDGIEHQRGAAAGHHSQHPARERARSARAAADNVVVRTLGRAARLRLRAESALGPRHRARDSRFRARDENLRRALRGPDGRGRAAGTRADQLHAEPAHERARLHRSASRRSW